MTPGHGTSGGSGAAYLNSQMAAALKQQQQQQFLQRQLMAEQVTELSQGGHQGAAGISVLCSMLPVVCKSA